MKFFHAGSFPEPLGGFVNCLLLQTHLLQEGSIGFLLDDPGKGPLVVADNADSIDGYIIHEPLPLHQSQRIIDWNLLVYPDDGGLDQGMVLTKLFLGVENFLPFEKVQNQLRIGLLEKVVEKSLEFCPVGLIQFCPVGAKGLLGHTLKIKVLADNPFYGGPSLIPEFLALELGIGLNGHYVFEHAPDSTCRRLRADGHSLERQN